MPHQKSSKKLGFSSFLILTVYSATSVTSPYLSWAKEDQNSVAPTSQLPSPSPTFKLEKSSSDYGFCDNQCDKILNISKYKPDAMKKDFAYAQLDYKGQPVPPGISKDDWDPDSKYWCQAHGVEITSKNVATMDDGTTPPPATSPLGAAGANTQVAGATPCPGVKQLKMDSGRSCKQLQDSIYRCNFKNSANDSKTSLDYCLAYKTSHDGKRANEITIGFDTAALAACTAACAALTIPGGIFAAGVTETACTALGLAAGGAELIATVRMGNSDSARKLRDVAAAAQLVGAAGTGTAAVASRGVTKAQQAARAAKEAEKGAKAVEKAAEEATKATDNAAKATSKLAAEEAAEKAAKNLGDKLLKKAATQAAEDAVLQAAKVEAAKVAQKTAQKTAEKATKEAAAVAAKSGGKTATKAQKIMSCTTMALTAVILGLRVADRFKADKVKKDSCKNIKSLASSASILTNGGDPGEPIADPGPGNRFSSLSGQGGSTGTANSGSGVTSNFNNSSPTPDSYSVPCSQDPSKKCFGIPDQSPALDTNMINRMSPEGQDTLTQGLDNLYKNGLDEKIKSAGTAGPIIASALGDHANTEFGRGLVDMAEHAANHADLLNFLGAIPASGGTGGSAISAAPAELQTDLSGAISVDGGGASLDFQVQKPEIEHEDGDIWHSHFTGTIFDVVTKAIKKNKSRIVEIEWELALNRALVGLPPKKH